MDTVTHALAPVILAHVCLKRSKGFGRWGLVAIAIGGALPDLLTPHFSLEARMSSWSHGLPFWAAFSGGLFLASVLSARRLSLRLACFLSMAYLFHLVCDSISGGINWLYPVADLVWGDYWISPVFWIPLDIVCILSCYYLFRLQPFLERRRAD